MPAQQVCQNFFHDALALFHKYRQNALLDATIALINGADQYRALSDCSVMNLFTAISH